MWKWINIFKPIGNFFSGLVRYVRNYFASDQQLLPVAETSSTPALRERGTKMPSALLLNMLPEDVFDEINTHLKPTQGEQSCFVLLGRTFYEMKQPKRLLSFFLQDVVNGNQQRAEAILKLNPELLKHEAIVMDYSGRTICGTALQIALGAEDVKYHANEECMVEMLMRYLRQLEDGEKIINDQINKQYPQGWEEREHARAERDSNELRSVVAAIGNAQSDCSDAIEAFRKYLDAENKYRGVIKTGKHFNARLIADACYLYTEKFHRFGGANSPKNILFWRLIIGYIERYLPTCYAQAFAQGLFKFIGCKEKLDRRLTFTFGTEAFYYPLNSLPANRLGYDYAVSPIVGMADSNTPMESCVRYESVYRLYRVKNTNISNIYSASKQSLQKITCPGNTS